MTTLLEEAVAELRTLPEDEQDRAAAALVAFTRDRQDYTLSMEQIEGIRHATSERERFSAAHYELWGVVLNATIAFLGQCPRRPNIGVFCRGR
jgi:hypothetical protein